MAKYLFLNHYRDHGFSGRVAFRAHYLGVPGCAPCDSRVLIENV